MQRYALAVIVGALAALLRQSFFAVLPLPLAAVDPVLIVGALYVAKLDGDKALVSAAIAGGVMDALSTMPFGTHLAAYTISVMIAHLLFTRVFTSHDWPGILMITIAGYLTISTVLGASRVASNLLSGGEIWASFKGDASMASLALATAVQIGAMAVTLIVASRFQKQR